MWDHALRFQVAQALLTNYLPRVTLLHGAYQRPATNKQLTDKVNGGNKGGSDRA